MQAGSYVPPRTFEFPEKERKQCVILVVERDEDARTSLRSALRNLGFGEVTSVLDHYSGIKRFSDRRFTHVIFDAVDTNVPAREFLTRVLEINSDITAIPSSFDPTVDDIFELLKLGADGFIVKPFTQESVEEAIILATKGEPVADEILNASDRNQALASLALTALDSLATILRHARSYETAKREIPRTRQQFERAVRMGKLFAHNGDAGLVLAYIERAIECSEQSASRLGRTRRRRRPVRQSESEKAAQ